MTTFVLMAGLPGTGKSTLAGALARQLGGVVISKDTVRAALFPAELTDYTPEQDDLCFAMVIDGARYLALHGRTAFVFLDGRTFSRRRQVEHAVHAAKEAGCASKIILAACPDAIVEARLVADATVHPASNRTVELYREVKARFEPIVLPHLGIDTSRPIEVCVREAVAYLFGDGAAK